VKLRSKATLGTFIVLAAAGYLPASHAGGGHRGGGAVLDVITSGLPANERLANRMAAARGWGAGQQHCLDLLWDEESAHTWSASIANPQSGALGIPQALTHGGPGRGGTLGNEYGDFGLTDAQARKANSGDAGLEIRWGLNYIEATYVNPCGAWQFETSHVPNWY
jgi:peptidoglycan DL-endopeptidase CwlO